MTNSKTSEKQETRSNPLLQFSELPNRAIPFDKIRSEDFLPALKEHIRKAKEQIIKITQTKESPNFENTMVALETSGEAVDYVSGIFYNLLSAHTNDDLQNLASEIGPLLSQYSNDIILNGELFKRIEGVFNERETLNLNSEGLKLLEETYEDFVKNGARLNESQKSELRRIDGELSQLSPEFSNHVLKDTNEYEMWLESEDDLEGLPASSISAALAAAEDKGQKGKWLFTLHAPSVGPFLRYSAKRNLREKIWRAFSRRAFGSANDNQQNIKSILKLREERAHLLGFKNHAEFTLKKRMAESPDNVMKFVNELVQTYYPAAKNDLLMLEKFAESRGGSLPLKAWDISYYSEKLKHHKFKYEDEELRPYFPLHSVVEGVFNLASQLYELNFKKVSAFPTYHQDVDTYEVTDSKTNEFLGLFYTDFFPRSEKKGGAWMTNYFEQGIFEGEIERPHVSIVCNFTKPLPDKPSLLTFDEVQTLFHEFGHALHSLLSKVHYRSLSGTNVYWDFVELPSQIMENWALEPEVLAQFAKHYETGQVIPSDLVDKVREASRFMSGWMGLRQSQYALLDMNFHTAKVSDIDDVQAFEKQTLHSTQLLETSMDSCMACSFSHIFAGGYGAGYYSYKWAEVLDADAFEYFKEEGILNTKVATSFKNEILSRGGTAHPAVLYKNFRGRAPDPKALFRREGLNQK